MRSSQGHVMHIPHEKFCFCSETSQMYPSLCVANAKMLFIAFVLPHLTFSSLLTISFADEDASHIPHGLHYHISPDPDAVWRKYEHQA